MHKNPIVPGFAPDPTIIHVDGTYYLSNSSFHMFPGLPIYASKNLKSWTLIGNAINRPEQLRLEHAICMDIPDHTGQRIIGSTGLLAPTLRHHKGVFYMICTNLSVSPSGFKASNFYVTSTDIWANVWSDPIHYDWNGIDPSLFFDDDDRVYIQGQAVIGDRSKQPTGHIKQCELDIKTGKLIGEPKVIWAGWNSIDTEGPHVYKRNGWYYCLAAEGGTFEDHVLSIGRSRNVWGPYEAAADGVNPILTAKGTSNYIQNTGHGDMFQDAQGLWWAAVLAIRRGPGGRYPLSRETFLTPVSWTEEEWPVFTQPEMVMERPESSVLSQPDLQVPLESKHALLYIRDPHLESYTLDSALSEAKLTSSAADLRAETGTATFVGKRQGDLSSQASVAVKISKSSLGKKLVSGLAVYKDRFRYAQICYDHHSREVVLSYRQQDPASLKRIAAEVSDVSGGAVDFRIDAMEMKYVFSYRLGAGEWIVLGEVDALEMTARDFTGPVWGICCFGEEGIAQEFANIKLGERELAKRGASL